MTMMMKVGRQQRLLQSVPAPKALRLRDTRCYRSTVVVLEHFPGRLVSQAVHEYMH